MSLIESPGCLVKVRSESSDRGCMQRKLSREKIVEFDFSHHKSSENIPQHNVITHHPTKRCFQNNSDSIERSKTVADVDHCLRNSACDLAKNMSTNRINEIAKQSFVVQNKLKYSRSIPNKNVHQSTKFSNCDQFTSLPCETKSVMTSTCKLCNHNNCSKQGNRDLNDHSRNCSLPSSHSSALSTVVKPKCDSSQGCCTINRRTTNSSLSLSLLGNNKYSKAYLSEDQKLNQGIERDSTISTSTDCLDAIRKESQKLRDRVACSDLFLEVMGSAATAKNNNSSRFGKFVDIEIDFKGDPIGIHITHYMLEKSRVTNINSGERNFHIFYQLLVGADIQFLKSLKLYRNIEKYEILKNTSANDEDKHNFPLAKKSLEILGLSSDEIISIFRVLAVVLKLGNFTFVPVTNIDGSEGCHVSNDYELQETALLLNIDAQILMRSLTRLNTPWVHDDSGSELDARQASSMRNTLCRTLYSRLFTWLVNRINESLKSNQREKNLAFLDFYGFEVLSHNTFEQLAINYCNEKLHQSFLQNVLKSEQDLYMREGLEWTRVDFFDNESICEMIDKPSYGILSLLNENHTNSDESLLIRIQQCCAGHPNFLSSGPTVSSMSFKIRHFAGVVTYSIQGFLEKNADIVPKSLSSCLFQSKLLLVQNLFPEGNPKRASKKPTSLSSNLRTQLQTLLSTIKNRRNHYVFCIKPNDARQSKCFDLALVQHQVRYMSLMPLVNLYRTGHCFHMTHKKFFHRYKLLSNLTWPRFNHGSTVESIAIIIHSVPLPSAEFTIGTKHVFVRSPRTVFELEGFRKVRLDDLAVLIQKTFRMYMYKKRFLQMKASQIIIASAWRTWRAREEYRTMKYKKQLQWAVQVIQKYYFKWRIRQFLLTILVRLPPDSMSPLSTAWPAAPKALLETSRLLCIIYHRWRCYKYRKSFDQTSRNRMREKVTASIIFKDRKASYARSIAHPFLGDYVRLRQNVQWKKYSIESNDQYVVFADIINKITRSSGKLVPVLLVISTASVLLLDQRTLQVKYRIPAAEIYRISLSPYLDDIAVFHVKADHSCARELQYTDSSTGCLFQSEFGRKKGDFVIQTRHVIEIVTKLFLVIQNAIAKPPDVHISTEFDANFGQQTVVFIFKTAGAADVVPGQPKVSRRGNRMEITV